MIHDDLDCAQIGAMVGLKAKYFSPENLAFSQEIVFLLQPLYPKILAPDY